MFPPDNQYNTAPIILKCWFWHTKAHQYVEGEIIEASAETQTAQIRQRGTSSIISVHFSNIRNVSLARGFTGKVMQSFGSPRSQTPWLLHNLPAATYSEV